ncbi:hypothetical protein Vafri_2879 [Volvox africanus]|uniref:Uncharacterized protein n=1 Tax=Volvox africanus TaxID=51714 RepID=A0A8J4EU61_9CHLO|nr:hypothetical protein Vafri_2879 [Volvox africanus]
MCGGGDFNGGDRGNEDAEEGRMADVLGWHAAGAGPVAATDEKIWAVIHTTPRAELFLLSLYVSAGVGPVSWCSQKRITFRGSWEKVQEGSYWSVHPPVLRSPTLLISYEIGGLADAMGSSTDSTGEHSWLPDAILEVRRARELSGDDVNSIEQRVMDLEDDEVDVTAGGNCRRWP